MPQGTLEVLLVSAKGLENTDFLSNMDPYVILTCRTQEQKSSVASGEGSDPEWNENFTFNVSEGASNLILKIMDSDGLSQDDFVGETTISLEPLFTEGSIPTTSYNVVKDQNIVERFESASLSGLRQALTMAIVLERRTMADGRSLHTWIE